MNDARPQQALEYSKDIRILSNNTTVPKKYGWVEVYRDTTGNWNNMTNSTGNVTYDPAYERNNAICPANTVCRADRDPITGQLIFTHRSQIVTNEQAPGLYSAYFFPPPIAFYFDIKAPGNYPGGYGILYNKSYIQAVNAPGGFGNGPECGRFDAYTTEILYPDGTVYYTKSYSTTGNPLTTTVIVPLPVLPVGQSFKVKYTVYPCDGNIAQIYECVSFNCGGYVFPGDSNPSTYRDIRYVGCPFTEFQGGTYGQIKYECNGLGPLIDQGMPPTGTVWPPPNLVSLKLAPTIMTASSALVPAPEPIPPPPFLPQYDYAKAVAYCNAINALTSNWTVESYNAPGSRGSATFFGGYRESGSESTKIVVYLEGQANCGFEDPPGFLNGFWQCNTATRSGFTFSRSVFYMRSGPIGGTEETYPMQDTAKNLSYDIADPYSLQPVMVVFGVGLYKKSASVSFS